jgi:hypothetical protein
MTPTIIIEIQNGSLEALYSNTDVNFYVIDRDNESSGGPTVSGPFTPTLVQADLRKTFPDDLRITGALQEASPPVPYF